MIAWYSPFMGDGGSTFRAYTLIRRSSAKSPTITSSYSWSFTHWSRSVLAYKLTSSCIYMYIRRFLNLMGEIETNLPHFEGYVKFYLFSDSISFRRFSMFLSVCFSPSACLSSISTSSSLVHCGAAGTVAGWYGG